MRQLIVQLQCKFIVAITPLMFSPGITDGECKSIRLGAFPLSVIGPGAPTGGESGGVGTLLLADAWEDGAEEPASEVPPSLSGLILLLLLLLLWPLLG